MPINKDLEICLSQMQTESFRIFSSLFTAYELYLQSEANEFRMHSVPIF